MNNENVNLQQTTSDTNGMIHKSLNDLKYNDSIISKLKRKDITDRIYEYKSNNSENNNYVNEFLNIVEDYISKSMFEYDDDFIFGGRKNFYMMNLIIL